MARQIASTGEVVPDTTESKPEQILKVKVYSPFKTYFDAKANSISAENDSGPFDVLPRHHRFLTLLNPCDLVIRNGDNQQQIRISRGIMHVRQDQVTVFLDV